MGRLAEWPEEERPRERLRWHGASALSHAELLAILLRSGKRGESVVQLAQRLLGEAGSLHALLALGLPQLEKKLGKVQAITLHACAELARRLGESRLRSEPLLNQPSAVREFLGPRLRDQEVEIFSALFLDAQLRLIAYEELGRGHVRQAEVSIREVARKALLHNASAVMVAHNHPSGCREPSAADIALTRRLRQVLSEVDIQLLDHWLVADGPPVSMAERGLI